MQLIICAFWVKATAIALNAFENLSKLFMLWLMLVHQLIQIQPDVLCKRSSLLGQLAN